MKACSRLHAREFWPATPVPPAATLLLLAQVALGGLGGCSPDLIDPMKKQPKYLPYQQNSFFEDQRAMRPLVSGTVPRGRPAEAVNSGRTPQGELLTRIPAAISAASLETGRQRFNVICAACHGTLGDGNSIPARKMSLRPPPSLHIFKNRRDGFFYQEISLGYGFMPSFAHLLTPEERWDVVAYVRALQLSQSIRLDQAPAAVQQELEKTR